MLPLQSKPGKARHQQDPESQICPCSGVGCTLGPDRTAAKPLPASACSHAQHVCKVPGPISDTKHLAACHDCTGLREAAHNSCHSFTRYLEAAALSTFKLSCAQGAYALSGEHACEVCREVQKALACTAPVASDARTGVPILPCGHRQGSVISCCGSCGCSIGPYDRSEQRPQFLSVTG